MTNPNLDQLMAARDSAASAQKRATSVTVGAGDLFTLRLAINDLAGAILAVCRVLEREVVFPASAEVRTTPEEPETPRGRSGRFEKKS